MKQSFVRRTLTVLVAAALALAVTSCGDDPDADADTGAIPDRGKVTVVGQQFTEAALMTELYAGVLENLGFDVTVKNVQARDVYLDDLTSGAIQVSADYLASAATALNVKANGEDAPAVASPNADTTLAELVELTAKYQLSPLKPAEALDANAFAVTQEFAEKNDLTTLSDLGASGLTVKMGGAPECTERVDCKLGLEDTYGIKIGTFYDTGFGSQQTKDDLVSGKTQLGLVGTTDATLEKDGLVILEDDKSIRNAENLIPIVNTEWLEENPDVAEALNALSAVLTTADLTGLIGQVDLGREKAADVAAAYLAEKGLLA